MAGKRPSRGILLAIFGSLWAVVASAQPNLDRLVSASFDGVPLKQALDSLGRQADVSFSYNSRIVPVDSLVRLHVASEALGRVLQRLFDERFVFVEYRRYVIIRYAPYRLSLIPGEVQGDERGISITGRVVDDRTGLSVANASVYDSQLLAATLTDFDGRFLLRLRSPRPTVSLTVSKEHYADVTMFMNLQGVVVDGDAVDPTAGYLDEDAADRVERTFWGRLLLSSRQRLQSLNLRGFFTERPYQMSLTPGLSTHGLMSGHVVDKFSLNVIGGYTAGVDGLEVAGAFNINRGDVRFAQFAGLFNLNGGEALGIQLAGGYNVVMGPVRGLQAAGVFNHVKDSLAGVQLSGVYNRVPKTARGLQGAGVLNVTGDVDGLQLSGVWNHLSGGMRGLQGAGVVNVTKAVDGVQLAGVVNWAAGDVRGAQLAGVFNRAKTLRGIQLGIVNVADSSDGYGVGLLNIILKNGYYAVNVTRDEALHLSVRTGIRKFYSILMVGVGERPDEKLSMYGLGLGSSRGLGKRLRTAVEVTSRQFHLGDWDAANSLYKLEWTLHGQILPHLSVFAGPSLNIWYSDQPVPHIGYANVGRQRSTSFDIGGDWSGWVGVGVGVSVRL